MISDQMLNEALHALFAFSPSAVCISTAGAASQYLAVNPAYLALTGHTWAEIKERDLTTGGSAIADDARDRRMGLLETVGSYKLEEADIRHASGAVIPTLISAQRRVICGEAVDIEIIHDNSERKRAQMSFERALFEAAHTDGLTGLPNRARFDQLLAEALPPSNDALMGLAYIDLNGFKAVNDHHGHAGGDHLLCRIATRLRARLLPSEVAARLGGDEFAILFSCRTTAKRHILSRFTRLASEVLAPVAVGGMSISVGAAIGIVLAAPADTPETLLQSADRLMYAAKKTRLPIAIHAGFDTATVNHAA